MQVRDERVDGMITKLLEVRGKKPGKNVQLSEDDIKHLCTKSRELFISQPNLLELEAPIKICGKSLPTTRDAHIAINAVYTKCRNKNSFALSVVTFVYKTRVTKSIMKNSLCLNFDRRCSWTVLRSIENIRVWRLPTRSELSFPW